MKRDFVTVKLSPKGEELAGPGQIGIANGRCHFRFKPGVAQEVTLAYDWRMVLSREYVDGEPLFVIVEEDKEPPQNVHGEERTGDHEE